ncbi:hypothetical protein ACIQCR_31415 [Streptomyces sp. NPDC093249]|uniref:hypothetical protein n=1 Tax=unclassified Streptomyces TaxID=2593676 RepID=UPI0038199587
MTYTPEGDVYVFPRYLAGSDWCGDAAFVPVSHWPTVHLEKGPCQMLVTSPDQRPELASMAQLTPLTPPTPPAPTPLDIQRAQRRPPAITTRSVPRWSTTTRPPATATAAATRAGRR